MALKIKLNNVCKTFDNKKVLKDINFEINEGKKIVILGKSGVGKSTLLNILAGFDKEFKGQLDYSEINTPPNLDIGFVFQEFDQLFPWMSVVDNIIFPVKKKAFDKKRLEKLLELIELEESKDKFPNELSGGMKQRVAIARSIYNKPKILFLDEPFSSLDNSLRSSLQDILIKVSNVENLTFVFVTHDIREAIKISDEIIILKNDKVIIIENSISKKIAEKNIDEFDKEYIDFYQKIISKM
ncbi:ABC transporter ATP-binding protein [Helicovermis profundi]|uniref:ABC transporter ATP-binding protein n=1 Tax=Helicovermis profundi TaxID=3065157 RepID=A0AAU9EMM1_9FIRM|nr:ABC transporter ATP-binding protein [Clostridia bacterium S502]